MSSFTCEHCGTDIIDGPNGYVTECEHYPMEVVTLDDLETVDLDADLVDILDYLRIIHNDEES